jgi:hypothetical protein
VEPHSGLRMSGTESPDDDLIQLCEVVGNSGMSPMIPRTFSRRFHFERTDHEIRSRLEGATIEATFNASLKSLTIVTVSSLKLSLPDASGITPTLLQEISVPNLVHTATYDAVENAQFWTPEGHPDADEWLDLLKQSDFLAQIYWLEHASQGNPRQVLMRYLGMPQSTCSVLIRKLRNDYTLPPPRTQRQVSLS